MLRAERVIGVASNVVSLTTDPWSTVAVLRDSVTVQQLKSAFISAVMF
jgi:hypothetical protein